MRLILGVLAASACCALPSAASAATVSSDGSLITFRSGHEDSDLVIRASIRSELLYAGGLLTVGAGCLTGSPVTCDGGDWDIALGAGDDRKKSPVSSFSETVRGGAGDDEIFAGGIRNHVTAGSGDDIALISNDGGTNEVAGNRGDDLLESFGDGLSVVTGGAGDDIVVGNAADANDLSGGPGDDVVISTRMSGRFVHGDADGGAGDDVIAAPATGAREPWTWTTNGGPGADTILGSEGIDTISGGSGDDAIQVSGDGLADTVSCGHGHDAVYADTDDVVAADCEQVLSGPLDTTGPVDDALAAATSFIARAFHPNLEAFGPLLPS